MLITKCICGNTEKFKRQELELKIKKCECCGVIHQEVDMTPQDYEKFYSSGYYSKEFQKEKKVETFDERYAHDVEVAEVRIRTYWTHKVPMEGNLLDIGCGNCAFIDVAGKHGYHAMGIDLHTNDRENVYTDLLSNMQRFKDYFDVITMHDCIEHVIDIHSFLTNVKHVLKDNGFLIIDCPDFYSQDGMHHWKKIEHLWFLSQKDLTTLLMKYFKIIRIDIPIKGKVVFYCKEVKQCKK